MHEGCLLSVLCFLGLQRLLAAAIFLLLESSLYPASRLPGMSVRPRLDDPAALTAMLDQLSASPAVRSALSAKGFASLGSLAFASPTALMPMRSDSLSDPPCQSLTRMTPPWSQLTLPVCDVSCSRHHLLPRLSLPWAREHLPLLPRPLHLLPSLRFLISCIYANPSWQSTLESS